MRLPLAIYSAEHGLDWKYDKSAISYAELDAVRTVWHSLPDFDSGDAGFEGVAAVDGRVFAVRCFRAAKWDFAGRDSLYMAVTWVPRPLAAETDFEALLRVPELNEPTHAPPTAFAFAGRAESVLGREIASAPSDATICYSRPLSGGAWQRQDVASVSVGRVAPRPPLADESDAARTGCEPYQGTPPQKRNALRVAVAVLLAAGALAWVAYDYFKTRNEVKDDGSREVPARECGAPQAGITNACGAVAAETARGAASTNAVRHAADAVR